MKENFAKKNEAYKPKIKIIGIGGCGINSVNAMIENNICGVDFFVIDSNKESLNSSMLDEKYRIQTDDEIQDKVKEIVKDTDILFIINGISKGLSDIVTIISKAGKEQGAINIVFAITPAKFEGERKNETAEKALQKFMEKESGIDSIINVSNERFIESAGRKSTLNDLFNLVNEEVSKCIKAIIDIFNEEKNLIAVGFKDFKSFIKNVGFTGIGIAGGVRDNVSCAIENVLDYPSIRGSFEYAKKVLISIQGGKDLTLLFFHEIAEAITNKTDDNADVMLSVQIDNDNLQDNEFKIIVITV